MALETQVNALQPTLATDEWQSPREAEISKEDLMAQQMLGSLNNGMFKVLRGVAGIVVKAKEGVQRWDAAVGNVAEKTNMAIDNFNQRVRDTGNSIAESVGQTLDRVDAFVGNVDDKIDQAKEGVKGFVKDVVSDVTMTKNELGIEINSLKEDISQGTAEKVLKISKFGLDYIAKPISAAVQKGVELAVKATPEAIRTSSNLLAAVEQASVESKPQQAEALEKSSQFARRLEHGILAIAQYGMEGKRVPDKVRAIDANRRVEAVSRKLERQGLGFMANAIRGINNAINNAEASAAVLREEAETSKAKAETHKARANKWQSIKESIKVNALSGGVEALSKSFEAGINQIKQERAARYERQKHALLQNNPALEAQWNRQFANV